MSRKYIGGCMYASFANVVLQLADKFGEPCTSYHLQITKYGKEKIIAIIIVIIVLVSAKPTFPQTNSITISGVVLDENNGGIPVHMRASGGNVSVQYEN